MFKLGFVILFIFTIAGCHDLSDNESNSNNAIEYCRQSTSIDEYEMIEPTIPVTGVERKKPINLVSRIEFIKRLRHSKLWNIISDKFEENEDYTDTFTFEGSDGYIRILGESNITSLTYGFNDAYKRNQLGQNLSEQDKFEMEQTINLIVQNEKVSSELFKDLYSDYLYKIDNQIVLNQSSVESNKVYHSQKFYKGILFELWGIEESGHPIKECNLNIIEKLTIN